MSDDLTNDDVNALRDAERFHLVLRGEDLDRLEMVCAMYGITKAAAIRVSLVSMCQQLGLIK